MASDVRPANAMDIYRAVIASRHERWCIEHKVDMAKTIRDTLKQWLEWTESDEARNPDHHRHAYRPFSRYTGLCNAVSRYLIVNRTSMVPRTQDNELAVYDIMAHLFGSLMEEPMLTQQNPFFPDNYHTTYENPLRMEWARATLENLTND